MGARTIAFVSNVALPLVLVRRLNQHEFGLYKQVFLIVGSAVITLPVGFTMSAYYFLPREEAKGRIVLNGRGGNQAVALIAEVRSISQRGHGKAIVKRKSRLSN